MSEDKPWLPEPVPNLDDTQQAALEHAKTTHTAKASATAAARDALIAARDAGVPARTLATGLGMSTRWVRRQYADRNQRDQ